MRRLLIPIFFMWQCAAGPQRPERICNESVATFARSAHAATEGRRVIRVQGCESGVLQVLALGGRGQKSLAIETNRTSIVSASFASDSVFVIQTGGASSNMLHVIVFDSRGDPQLALERSFKAYATVSVTWKTVTVTIPATDVPAEIHTYPTGLE